MTPEDIRTSFEAGIKASKLAATTPLGAVTINDTFSHYAHPDTDTMWIGYLAGFRSATRAQAESRAEIQRLSEFANTARNMDARDQRNNLEDIADRLANLHAALGINT